MARRAYYITNGNGRSIARFVVESAREALYRYHEARLRGQLRQLVEEDGDSATVTFNGETYHAVAGELTTTNVREG